MTNENGWQVRDKGVSSSYHHGEAVSSLVDDCQTMHPPPANIHENRGQIDEKPRITSFTSIEMVHTHAPQQRGFFRKKQQGLGNLVIVQMFKMPSAATSSKGGSYK